MYVKTNLAVILTHNRIPRDTVVASYLNCPARIVDDNVFIDC